MDKPISYQEEQEDKKAEQDTIINQIVNKWGDDLAFLKKVNKITFGLMTGD